MITGIIIPTIQTKYLDKCLRSIQDSGLPYDTVICVVNDGNISLHDEIEHICSPFPFVHVLHLEHNHGFAGVNNTGWRYLIKKYPSIKYLGTLNDDTIPHNGWLNALVDGLNKYPQVAISAPIMETNEGWLGMRKDYAVYTLKDADTPLLCSKSRIRSDTFVPSVGGFCFLARRDVLEDVDFFDENYRNSCEDVDLCLKINSKNWLIVVCKDSRVFHYGGKSRYMKSTNTDLVTSHDLLAKKWGYDLTRFNVLNHE